MGRATRIVVGVLAFLPLLAVVGILAGLTVLPPQGTVGDLLVFPYANATLYAGVLFMFMLALFFGAFVMNDRRIRSNSKIWWAVSFIVAGPISIPLYWYVHVLHAPHHSLDS